MFQSLLLHHSLVRHWCTSLPFCRFDCRINLCSKISSLPNVESVFRKTQLLPLSELFHMKDLAFRKQDKNRTGGQTRLSAFSACNQLLNPRRFAWVVSISANMHTCASICLRQRLQNQLQTSFTVPRISNSHRLKHPFNTSKHNNYYRFALLPQFTSSPFHPRKNP